MKNDKSVLSNQAFFEDDQDFPLRAIEFSPQEENPSHSHEFSECVLITGGSGVHQCENHALVPLHRGDILVIPTGGRHAYLECDNLCLINLIFDATRLPALLMELYSHPAYRKLFMRDASRFDTEDYPKFSICEDAFAPLEHYARQLSYASAQKNHCWRLGLFMVILSQLCDVAPFEGKRKDIPVGFDFCKVRSYLERNFARSIYLRDLSRLCGMSIPSFDRHFRSAMGISPMLYLRNLRLKNAARLLVNSKLSIKEIADVSGFSSVVYFYRVFKESYRVPPKRFRQGEEN